MQGEKGWPGWKSDPKSEDQEESHEEGENDDVPIILIKNAGKEVADKARCRPLSQRETTR